MNGKGDSPRNCFSEQFRNNWELIFGSKDERKSADEQECAAGTGEKRSGAGLSNRVEKVAMLYGKAAGMQVNQAANKPQVEA